MVMMLLNVGEEEARMLELKWKNLFPAFALAQKHFENLAQQWRPAPNGEGYGMYVTQPFTGRHRKIHLYPQSKGWIDEETGTWRTFNPRQAEARKTWNNVVQGLSGWMSVNAAMEFGRDYGWDGITMYAQIHDALDADVHVNSLHKVPDLMRYMMDYPTNPSLTADLEAGQNWQPYAKDNPLGMRHVVDIPLWVDSKGREGYEE
jgi:hypothetical protein